MVCGERVEAARNDFGVGLLLSCLGHILLVYLLVFYVVPRRPKLGQPVVYSITLEGGKTLGGISQVPTTEKKEPIAPPKNIEEPARKEEPATSQADPKAEVSLSEKKAEPTAKPQVKEKETEKAGKAKPTAKPTIKQPTAADINKQYQQAMQRYRGESADAGGRGFGAARLGGSGMGGGVLRPPEFFHYRDLLKATIKRGWRWYDTSAKLVAQVYFEIAPDGTITNVQILQGSGNREYDDSVVRAIYKASPVPAPPESVYQWFKEVRTEFEPGD